MEYIVTDFEPDENGEGDLCCSVCQAVWLKFTGWDTMVEEGSCEHLMFRWDQDTDIGCKGLTSDELSDVIEKEYIRTSRNESSLDDLDGYELIQEMFFDKEFWEKISIPGVDCIIEYTEEGMACGPTSHTILFGMRKDA